VEKWLYARTAQLESAHWWFTARREIVRCAIERICRPQPGATILEVGCGTGGNLALLSCFGRVVGAEPDEEAIALARQRGIGTICRGSLPNQLPFEKGAFDLAVLLDVLEHVEHDREALEALVAVLKPGGCLLVTVPAFEWLWSRHDERHHHFRRYRLGELTRRLTGAGLRVEGATYFNTWLFPLIAAMRLLKQRARWAREIDDLRMPPRPMNRLLARLFASERHLIGRVRLRLGVSILACGRKVQRAHARNNQAHCLSCPSDNRGAGPARATRAGLITCDRTGRAERRSLVGGGA
jgi:SAM-dependent methyltransferase